MPARVKQLLSEINNGKNLCWESYICFLNTLVSHKGLANILCIIKFYSGMNTSPREIPTLNGNCETRENI